VLPQGRDDHLGQLPVSITPTHGPAALVVFEHPVGSQARSPLLLRETDESVADASQLVPDVGDEVSVELMVGGSAMDDELESGNVKENAEREVAVIRDVCPSTGVRDSQCRSRVSIRLGRQATRS
jgi:hypothetical protein